MKIGDMVELQWKSGTDGTFGWWFGLVLKYNEQGQILIDFTQVCCMEILVCFARVFTHFFLAGLQFAPSSSWRMLTLPASRRLPFPNPGGGVLGAVRQLPPNEVDQYKKHLEVEPKLAWAKVYTP